jgi:glycosyltransferase involved in cell wall biosynthesis
VPNVVLEALSTGLPVVTTRVGGIQKSKTDDDLGKMVAERSEELIADLIYQVINKPPDKNRL